MEKIKIRIVSPKGRTRKIIAFILLVPVLVRLPE